MKCRGKLVVTLAFVAMSSLFAVSACSVPTNTTGSSSYAGLAPDVFGENQDSPALGDTPGEGSGDAPRDAPGDGSGDAPGDGSGDAAIHLDSHTLNLVGTAGSTVMAATAITGSVGLKLVGVDLMDVNVPQVFHFVQPTCATQSCVFPGGIDLSSTLEMSCTPQSGMQSARVTVRGANGTTDSALLTCSATANTPAIQVPGSVGRLTTPVGTTVTAPLTITNSGNVALSVSLAFDPVADWQGACTAPTPCQVAVNSSLTIMIAFTPSKDGNRDSTLAVNSAPDAGTKFVSLFGTGTGGVLRVNEPATFDHDFGTIAKNQLSTFFVKMANPGNDGITITPSNPGAPFSVPTAGIGLGPNNGTGMFPVSCMSATPSGPNDAVITLGQSANTYDRNTSTIGVHCKIANTTVQVTPTPIDFKELHKGDPAGSITVTIKNPAGGGNVTINKMNLRNAPDALTLSAPVPGLPVTLAPDGVVTATLALATTEDITLTDVVLQVEILETETALLELPVTGKVGTPSARVIPESLDLGTVCVGTPITGMITLQNNGTAALKAMAPMMSATTFTAVFNPIDFPATGAELLPNNSVTVGVMPATSTVGRIEATLVWPVDVPTAPFMVPITLEYVASGTALSPSRLVFGAIDVNNTTTAQTVTLENCGTEPVLITVNGVAPEQGDGSAWAVEPRTDQRPLLPAETMKIMAAFAPKKPGHHKARIVLDVAGEMRFVALEGDALGARLEQTSFYACDCSGSGAPAHGWPIAAAVVLVFRRRRR